MYEFVQVGGCVRDGLLGLKPKDIDYVVLGCHSFEDMIAAIESKGGQIFGGTERPEFAVVRGWLPEIGPADFALPRDDGFSTDGRRPDSVVIHDDLCRDLARRDFTVNAMAMREDGTLVDPFGGQSDLNARVLRFVGDPVERLNEDRLRAFRALRFAVTKGFTMLEETVEAVGGLPLSAFESVSAERVREELVRCFHADTNLTLSWLTFEFDNLLRVMFDKGVWLKPTLEK